VRAVCDRWFAALRRADLEFKVQTSSFLVEHARAAEVGLARFQQGTDLICRLIEPLSTGPETFII
jgi:hypothetical protein